MRLIRSEAISPAITVTVAIKVMVDDFDGRVVHFRCRDKMKLRISGLDSLVEDRISIDITLIANIIADLDILQIKRSRVAVFRTDSTPLAGYRAVRILDGV